MRPKRQANKQQEIEAPDEDTDDTDDATPHIWGTLHNQTDANQALHKCLNIISHYNKSEIMKSVSFGYYGQDNIVIYSRRGVRSYAQCGKESGVSWLWEELYAKLLGLGQL